jgi:hypothetical protein
MRLVSQSGSHLKREAVVEGLTDMITGYLESGTSAGASAPPSPL